MLLNIYFINILLTLFFIHFSNPVVFSVLGYLTLNITFII